MPVGQVRLDEMGIELEGEPLEAAWAAFEQALPGYDFALFTRQEARKRWKQSK